MSRVPISEAKGKLAEIVRDSEDENVVLTRHGKAAAVVVSVARYNDLMEQLDDFEDRLSVHEREGVTMDFNVLSAESGL